MKMTTRELAEQTVEGIGYRIFGHAYIQYRIVGHEYLSGQMHRDVVDIVEKAINEALENRGAVDGTQSQQSSGESQSRAVKTCAA